MKTTTKADGTMAAVDLLAGMAPEHDELEGDALTECKRVLAMHGYRLQTAPKLKAVRGVDPEGQKTEVL